MRREKKLFLTTAIFLAAVAAQADEAVPKVLEWKDVEVQFVDGESGKEIAGLQVYFASGNIQKKTRWDSPWHWAGEVLKTSQDGKLKTKLPIRTDDDIRFHLGDSDSRHYVFGGRDVHSFNTGILTRDQLRAHDFKKGPLRVISEKPLVVGRVEIEDAQGKRVPAKDWEAFLRLGWKDKAPIPMGNFDFVSELVQGEFRVYPRHLTPLSMETAKSLFGRTNHFPLEVMNVYIDATWDRRHRKIKPILKTEALYPGIYKIIQGAQFEYPGVSGKPVEHVVVLKRAEPWGVPVIVKRQGTGERLAGASAVFRPDNASSKGISVKTDAAGNALLPNLPPSAGAVEITLEGYEGMRLPLAVYAEGAVQAALVPLVDVSLMFTDIRDSRSWVMVQRTQSGHPKEMKSGQWPVPLPVEVAAVVPKVPDREVFVGLLNDDRQVLAWRRLEMPSSEKQWRIEESRRPLVRAEITVNLPKEMEEQGAEILVVDDAYGLPMNKGASRETLPDGARRVVRAPKRTLELPSDRKYRVYMRASRGFLMIGELNPKAGDPCVLTFTFDLKKYEAKGYPGEVSEEQVFAPSKP